MIEKRNQKYITHGEHKKVDGNIDNYFKKKNKNKNPRIKHFQWKCQEVCANNKKTSSYHFV